MKQKILISSLLDLIIFLHLFISLYHKNLCLAKAHVNWMAWLIIGVELFHEVAE